MSIMDIAKLDAREIVELSERGHHLAPADGRRPTFISPSAGEEYRDRTLGLTARGVASLAAQAANGGVPSKPSAGAHLTNNIWRVILLAAILWGASRNSTVHVAPDGITITPQMGANK